jgi:hypothetical protein
LRDDCSQHYCIKDFQLAPFFYIQLIMNEHQLTSKNTMLVTASLLATKVRTAALCAGLCFGTLLGSHAAAQALHARVFEAQTAIAKRDWAAAEKTLSQLDSGNLHVLYEWAQLYEGSGRVNDARNVYQALGRVPKQQLQTIQVVTRTAQGVQVATLDGLVAAGLVRYPVVAAAPAVPAAEVQPPKAVEPPPLTSLTVRTATTNNTSAALNTTDPALQALQTWVQAWTSKDMTTYFAAYVAQYRGDKKSPAAWQEFRKQNIIGKKKIAVELADVKAVALSPERVQISFLQNYVGDAYKDKARKTVVLVKQQGSWLIEKEATVGALKY